MVAINLGEREKKISVPDRSFDWTIRKLRRDGLAFSSVFFKPPNGNRVTCLACDRFSASRHLGVRDKVLLTR